MIYPEFLKLGDVIGVTAPSSGGVRKDIDRVILESARKNLEKVGYHVKETENVRTREKLVSSSAEERAKEFYELYRDKEVKHIIAATGGEFLMEILPYLSQYPLQEIKPKWVQGYSDVSLLLFYLTTKYNIATVHATNYGGYGRKEILPSFLNTLNILGDGTSKIQTSFEKYESIPINWQEGKELELPNLDTEVCYRNLYQGESVSFEGRIIGGCLDVLKTIIGTPYDETKAFCSQWEEGTLWYLENCEMSVCDFYRTLWQMREAGWFANAKGFLIGRTRSKEPVGEFTYEDALHCAFDSLKVPVIYDVDIGHTQLQWTMINGAIGEFSFDNGKGKLVTKFSPKRDGAN